jgi:branched-chain amino acid transport system permease protein
MRATWVERLTDAAIATFLWAFRAVIVVVVVVGSVLTIASGRYSLEVWIGLAVSGASLGSIYALMALGYTMVYGILRMINFAHGEIFMSGAFAGYFTAAFLAEIGVLNASPVLSVLSVLVMVVAAMAVSTILALLVERIAYRPLRRRGASRLAALISAIGASLVLQEVFALWKGRDTIALPRVMDKADLFTVGTGIVRSDKLLIFVAAILMMLALDRFVTTTRLGRGIRATAQDPETAVLMGVDIDRVVLVTFLLGGIMAGAAGVLFVVFFELTRSTIGFLLGVKAFTAAVLGGIGNLRGALLGGFSLGLFENYGAAVFGTAWKDVIAFTILVVVLMFRPTGLLGESLARARA